MVNDWFWGSWFGTIPLENVFPVLYDINKEQTVTVHHLASNGWSLSFRRWLSEDIQHDLKILRDSLLKMALGEDVDQPKWNWTKSGIFSVNSMYRKMHDHLPDKAYKFLWKVKLRLRIKIFLWLILHNAILTKDNLLRRNGKGDPKCFFCNELESINHLFFECGC